MAAVADEEIGVGAARGRHLLALELLTADAELLRVGAVERHLGCESLIGERRQLGHGCEVGGASGGRGEHTGVLDEEPIVLPHPVPEARQIQPAVADASDEWVGVLRLPHRVHDPSEAVAEALRHGRSPSYPAL